MLTRLLNLCGMYLGQALNISLPGPDNPTGYWENVVVADINIRLLAHFGGTLDDPPSLPDEWWRSPALKELREEASEIVDGLYSGYDVWGWKDPRTTVTVPFWREIVPNLRYVITIRNPLDVAPSVVSHAQGRISARKAMALWQYYTELALRNAPPGESIIVHYEDLLARPRATLAPVLAFLGLPRIRRGSDLERTLDKFIDPQLRHMHHTLEDVVSSSSVFSATRLLYEGLVKRPSATHALFVSPAREEHIARGWGGDEPEIIKVQRDYLSKLTVDVEWQRTHIAELTHWVAQQEEGIEWLSEQNGSLESALEDTRSTLADTRSTLADTRNTLADTRRWAETQRQGVEWHVAHRAALERQIEDLNRELAELREVCESEVRESSESPVEQPVAAEQTHAP